MGFGPTIEQIFQECNFQLSGIHAGGFDAAVPFRKMILYRQVRIQSKRLAREKSPCIFGNVSIDSNTLFGNAA